MPESTWRKLLLRAELARLPRQARERERDSDVRATCRKLRLNNWHIWKTILRCSDLHEDTDLCPLPNAGFWNRIWGKKKMDDRSWGGSETKSVERTMSIRSQVEEAVIALPNMFHVANSPFVEKKKQKKKQKAVGIVNYLFLIPDFFQVHFILSSDHPLLIFFIISLCNISIVWLIKKGSLWLKSVWNNENTIKPFYSKLSRVRNLKYFGSPARINNLWHWNSSLKNQ
jgi:hypothetical protein